MNKSTKTRNTKTKAPKSIAAQLQENWVDTGGEDMGDGDILDTISIADLAKKDRKTLKKINAKAKAPKVIKSKSYAGAPIPATRLFEKKMPNFKNATILIAMNDSEKTITFFNVYNGNLPASYDPTKYTYDYKPSVHDTKIESAIELEVTNWPSYVVNSARRTRKAK